MLNRITGIAIAAVALAQGVEAQVKIAFINAEAITASYKKFQEAQKEAQRFEEELTREFGKAQNELARMKENFDRQSLLMSEQRKKEEEQSIQKKQQELQQFLEEVSGQGGKLQRRTQELLEPVITEVNEAISRVAKDKGYDFVLNTASLAYANEDHDLTHFVLESLEEESSQAEGRPGAGSR